MALGMLAAWFASCLLVSGAGEGAGAIADLGKQWAGRALRSDYWHLGIPQPKPFLPGGVRT